MNVLCNEVVGVAVFALLREHATRLFADQPPVLARIHEVLDLVLRDEIGHVYFLRSRLGPVRLRLCRLALPLIARVLLADMPEAARVFGGQAFLDRVGAADVLGALPAGAEGMALWHASLSGASPR